MEHTSSVLTAIGHFHPFVLHFPIGLIFGALGLELWATLRGGTELQRATGALLVLASITAIVAVVCGLFLAQSGGYETGLLERHRAFGLATAALALTALILHRWSREAPRSVALALYRATLAACVIAMAGAGYYGGMITHGGETPFRLLATAVRGLVVDESAQQAANVSTAPDDLFQRSVVPIMESHCYECHGPEKQKSGLRLDSREAALAGGDSGKPAIVPGNAMTSRLVEAITLPVGNKRAMPPAGKPRLEPAEVMVLIDWINRGAEWSDDGDLHVESVPQPSAEALERLRAEGFRLSPLAQGYPLVRVDRVPDRARIAALAPIAEQIGWLNLAGFELEAGELRMLANMPYLTRLELQHSNVRDDDLAYVGELGRLKTLNVYGTQIGDAGLDHLLGQRSLERVYLWQTKASEAGVQRLRDALPSAVIDRGGGDEDNPEMSTASAANGLPSTDPGVRRGTP